MELPDIQNLQPFLQLPLKKVGIRSLRFLLKDRVAELSSYIALNSDCRGTHMSRFPAVCLNLLENVGLEDLIDQQKEALQQLQKKLNSSASYIKIRTDADVCVTAPITGLAGKLIIPWILEISLTENYVIETTVEIPISTSCPCSSALVEASNTKGIPHSQRAVVRITCRYWGKEVSKEFVWSPVKLFDLVAVSIKTIPSVHVKRPDELAMAHLSYLNAHFVEDACRLVHQSLIEARIPDFSVVVESFESIHTHSAIAVSCKGIEDGLR